MPEALSLLKFVGEPPPRLPRDQHEAKTTYRYDRIYYFLCSYKGRVEGKQRKYYNLKCCVGRKDFRFIGVEFDLVLVLVLVWFGLVGEEIERSWLKQKPKNY